MVKDILVENVAPEKTVFKAEEIQHEEPFLPRTFMEGSESRRSWELG